MQKRVDRYRQKPNHFVRKAKVISLSAVTLFSPVLGAVTTVHAQDTTWHANSAESIKQNIPNNFRQQTNRYTVQWGDTVNTIAEAFNINANTLIKDNNISNANLIYAGSSLEITNDRSGYVAAEGVVARAMASNVPTANLNQQIDNVSTGLVEKVNQLQATPTAQQAEGMKQQAQAQGLVPNNQVAERSQSAKTVDLPVVASNTEKTQTPAQSANTGANGSTPAQSANTGETETAPAQSANTGETETTPAQSANTGETETTPTQSANTDATDTTPAQSANTGDTSANTTQPDNTDTAAVSPSQSENNATPAATQQGVDVNKTVQWFYDREGKLTYSMYGSRNGTDGTADCSGAVTQAIYDAGGTKPAYLYNTDSLHDYLTQNGYSLIAENQDWQAQKGDVVIWGKQGQSGGAAGHVSIISTNDPNAKAVSVNYVTQGQQGTAVTEEDYNQFAAANGWPYSYAYRHADNN